MVPLPAWDVQIAAAFEQRLRRPAGATVHSTSASRRRTCSARPTRRSRQAGRGLFRRLVVSFSDDINATMAMEQRGGSLAEEVRLAEAERALRETLRLCAQSPAGRSCTSGVAELRLAEVILAGGEAGRAGEAADLLEAVRPQVEEQRLFRKRGLPVPAHPGRGPPGSGAIRPRQRYRRLGNCAFLWHCSQTPM